MVADDTMLLSSEKLHQDVQSIQEIFVADVNDLLDGIKVNVSQLGARLMRLQHLIKELTEGIVDLENDVTHLNEELSKDNSKKE